MSATTDATTTATSTRGPRNGVDTPVLFATLNAVKANPESAKFQFRAANQWVSGTHTRSTIQGFYGAGQEDGSRNRCFHYDADHPAVLVGSGLCHARRRACHRPAGLAKYRRCPRITLTRVESTNLPASTSTASWG